MTVALGSVIDRLVVMFADAVTVDVIDGPQPTVVRASDWVVVGGTETDDDGAVVEQVPSTLGPGTWRDETGQVTCSVWASTGSTALVECRQRALANAQACVDAVHDDPSLGGLLVSPNDAHVSEFRYQSIQTEQGAIARVVFVVAYQALITS